MPAERADGVGGVDPARAAATRNAQAGRAAPDQLPGLAPPIGGPPGLERPPVDQTVAELTRTLDRYADAVSFSVATLGPLSEWTRTAAREAETHPELYGGPSAAGQMRALEQGLELVYERLRRMGAPTAVAG